MDTTLTYSQLMELFGRSDADLRWKGGAESQQDLADCIYLTERAHGKLPK